MRRKIIVFAAIATAVMLTMMFSSIVLQGHSNFNNASSYNSQVQGSVLRATGVNPPHLPANKNFSIINSNPLEKNWLSNAYEYAYKQYGRNATSSRLDLLQFRDLIGFFSWYVQEYNYLPSNQRGISDKNASTAEAVSKIDRFIAPSKTVLNTFLRYYPDARNKIKYLDYGFDLARLQGRKRVKEARFVFGYIGTHIPAKGVDYLIKAFGELKGNTILKIWGRWRNDYTPALVELGNRISKTGGKEIQWMGEFETEKIVDQVFNKIDAVVVPSIWLENSPLVIHEAQEARIPVITANVGGMAEYVDDEVNGLLFNFRNISSLAKKMQRLIDEPSLGRSLGVRGYRYSRDGEVPSIEEHIGELLEIFNSMVRRSENNHSFGGEKS